jgi:PEP-CTERM motif
MKVKNLVAVAALALGTAVAANADSLNGTINLAGVASVPANSGYVNFSPTSLVEGAPTFPGVTTGDFAIFQNTFATMFGFGYTTATFTDPSVVFTDTVGSETLQFELTSITSYAADGSMIDGSGIFTINGDDATNGNFQFTTQSGQTIASFSATAETAATPEPASLALFGTGLLGIVGIARRKFNV